MIPPQNSGEGKPRGFDAFCGAGGCTAGYQRAGAHMVGCDIKPQPRYCGDEFVQGDALALLADVGFMAQFDFVHASPPCQFYASLSKGEHWRSIPPTRELLEETGLPYVIENIQSAAWDMRQPVQLCGSALGLRVRRHRLFECSFPVMTPPCSHGWQRRNNNRLRSGYERPEDSIVPVYGGGQAGFDIQTCREAMGIDWMTTDELNEAIPPRFTELIGYQLLQHINHNRPHADSPSTRGDPPCGPTES